MVGPAGNDPAYSAFQTDANPSQLETLNYLAPAEGLEPSTLASVAQCSSNWAMRVFIWCRIQVTLLADLRYKLYRLALLFKGLLRLLVPPMGLEPMTQRLKVFNSTNWVTTEFWYVEAWYISYLLSIQAMLRILTWLYADILCQVILLLFCCTFSRAVA